ncbi:MAG: outer membrane beta-barrel protein [Casimicrobiaceae bacterium]
MASFVASAIACALSPAVHAEAGGYFMGLRLDPSAQIFRFGSPGLRLGQGLEFGPTAEALTRGSTAFGGYQFESGLSIGASFSTVQGLGHTTRGVGLQLDASRWAGSVRLGHQVNVDVVSAFNWKSAMSLYGRFGIGRGDLRTVDPLAPAASGVDRTSMRYGIGVRYDFSPSLGLKLEMSRGVKSPWERVRIEPEGDSINFGLRWVF